MTTLIYLIAGEASGDALGAGLMRALRQLNPDVAFSGIGGEAMEHEGLQSIFPYRELSIMGFLEVIPHILKLLKRLRETALDIALKKPAVVVTIDSPGFNFRLAQAIKNAPETKDIRRIHYVAPSVWAYKPGRAKKTAMLFDALLALLPFEPPYFEKEELPTTFVGHPVLFNPQNGAGAAFRKRHNIGESPLLLVLPGSRKGEIKRHLSLFMEATKSLPDYKIAILAGPAVKDMVVNAVPPDTLIVDSTEKADVFAAATLALSKSGTVTLELAATGVPMVVAYKTSPISAWLIRRMILIKYASLVNIALNKPIVPELLQEECTVSALTQALKRIATSEAMQQQRKDCAEAIQVLRGNIHENPSMIAAQTILRCLAS